MADGIATAGECKLANISAEEVVFFDLMRVGSQILVDVSETQPRDGASDQRWNVGMFLSFALALQRTLHIVGAAAFALSGSDEQIISRDGERAWVPLGGNKTGRLLDR